MAAAIGAPARRSRARLAKLAVLFSSLVLLSGCFMFNAQCASWYSLGSMCLPLEDDAPHSSGYVPKRW